MDRYSWLLGLRGVIQHAKRNLIAGFAIGIGLIAIMTMIGYSKRIDDYLAVHAMYIQEPGHLAIVKRGGLRKRFTEPKNFSLKAHEVSKIEAYLNTSPLVDFYAPYLSGYGLIGNGCASFPFKAKAMLFDREEKILKHPEFLRVMGDYRPYRKGISHFEAKSKSPIGVSSGLAQRLDKIIGAPPSGQSWIFSEADCQNPQRIEALARDPNVQLLAQDNEGRLNAIDVELVNGFTTGLSFTDNTALTMGLKDLQDLLRTDQVSYIAVFLKDRNQAKELARKIKVTLIQDKIDIDAYVWNDKEWNFNFFASSNILWVTNIFTSLVIFVVVILSIINTLNIGLVESRREIGTLRSLGFTPSRIAQIFAIESQCVALLSVILGTLSSALIFKLVEAAQIPFKFPGATEPTVFLITPPLWTYPLACLGLVLLTVSTNYLIAKRYAERDILSLLDRGA